MPKGSILGAALEEAKGEADSEKYGGEPIDLLIDGDIPAYSSAAATDGKGYKVAWEMRGTSGVTVYKYKKQADVYADKLREDGYSVAMTVEYNRKLMCHHYSVEIELK